MAKRQTQRNTHIHEEDVFSIDTCMGGIGIQTYKYGFILLGEDILEKLVDQATDFRLMKANWPEWVRQHKNKEKGEQPNG